MSRPTDHDLLRAITAPEAPSPCTLGWLTDRFQFSVTEDMLFPLVRQRLISFVAVATKDGKPGFSTSGYHATAKGAGRVPLDRNR